MDIITINGTDYYIAEDYSYYVIEVNGTLTLKRSGSVNCYSTLSEYNNSNSGYPRVQIQYGQKARYVTRINNQTITSDLSLNSWSISHKNVLADPMMNIYLGCIIAIAAIWRLLRGNN